MAKASRPGNQAKAGISSANTTEEKRKSLLQQIVDENSTEGLNEKYVEKALAHNGGFGPDYGDPAEQNSKFRATAAYIDSKNAAKSTDTNDRNAFIQAYIENKRAGGSDEDAAEAGRQAIGISSSLTGKDNTENASETGAAAYAARVQKTQATQTPTYSQQTDETPMTEEKYISLGMEAEAEKQNNSKKPSFLETVRDILTGGKNSFVQADGRTADWGTAIPSGAASGGDGALKQSLADQTGESGVNAAKPEKTLMEKWTGVTTATLPTPQETGRPEQSQITQYLWPEDENAIIRYQSNEPFEDYQKILIDEMNAAYDAQDFDRGNELRKIYSDKEDSYNAFLRDRYQQTLPKGQSAYQSLQNAISAGDVRAYNEAQNTLVSNGYSRNNIEEQASEMIHNSDKSEAEKEKDLKKYLGLSTSDAQATTLMWWWTDNKGKEAADTDKNGKLRQDELGAYLKELEESNTLTEAQAAAIWKETYPTAKTDYAKWKGKNSKPDNPVLTAADADGNGRLKQDELGAYLKQQEAGGMSEEEAAAIWKEQFPTAKTDYSKWKGKQKK